MKIRGIGRVATTLTAASLMLTPMAAYAASNGDATGNSAKKGDAYISRTSPTVKPQGFPNIKCDILGVERPHVSKGAGVVHAKARVRCNSAIQIEVNGSMSAGVQVGPNATIATSTEKRWVPAGKIETFYIPTVDQKIQCKKGVFYQAGVTVKFEYLWFWHSTVGSRYSDKVTAC